MAGPKLLPKRRVTAEVATQKAQDIKKGLELAKKIDALRETKVEEEGNLEQFRASSVAIVQGEINVKIRESERLDREIRLKEAKSAAISPSVEEQWRQINEAKSSFEEEKVSFLREKSGLQQAVALNIQRERESEIEKQRIAEERKQSHDVLQNAEQMRKDAVKHLQEARSQAQEIVKEAIEREQAVSIRERRVEEEKEAVDVRTQTNQDWEVDLSTRERKLKTNMETFIRSQNYLKNKN